LGCGRGVLIGTPVGDWVQQRLPGAAGTRPAADYSTVASRENATTPEHTARRRDGTEVPVEISFSPLDTPRGLCVINILRDISERRVKECRRLARSGVRRVLGQQGAFSDAALEVLHITAERL